MRHVFNKFSKIMWKHNKRIKIELHISKCKLQHSALLWFIANDRMCHLCFCRNFSSPDSVIFYCTTWCPDTCKENFVSAAMPKNALLNEWPLAFETELRTVHWIALQIQWSIQIHCYEKHSVRYESCFKIYLIA